MNDSIKNALIDMTNEYQSDTKTVNDNISDMLQKLTAANYKKSKHEEQFTDISSKLSYYEYRHEKLIIKDTQIHPLSLQITKLRDTSSKKENHEEQFIEIMSKFSYYEIRLDKLRTANSNKIDTSNK